MRSALLLVATLATVSCAWEGQFPDWRWTTAYYDRNHDGIVDVEFHHMEGAADTDWALIDTTFHGKYDVRVYWGYAVEKKRVNIPVPRQVKITAGPPPVNERYLH